MKKHCFNLLLVVLVIALLADTVQSEEKKASAPPPQLVITEVRVEFGTEAKDSIKLFITGKNFTNGGDPAVTLAGTPLNVLSNDDGLILAEGEGFIEGDYLLTISTGPAVKNYDSYNLTIGAGGPKGDKPAHQWDGTALSFENPDGKWGASVDLKGDKGDQGIQGIQGSKGDKGDQGIQGSKGDKGDQGIQGPKGDKGDQGIQGIRGALGEIGPAGMNCWDLNNNGICDPEEDKGGDGCSASDCQGLQGEQGPQGPQGPTGPTGPAGTSILSSLSVVRCENEAYCECPTGKGMLTWSATCPYNNPPVGYYLQNTWMRCRKDTPDSWASGDCPWVNTKMPGVPLYVKGFGAECVSQYVNWGVNTIELVNPKEIELICY